MLFGNENEKGLSMKKGKLQVVTVGEDGITLGDILVHDATEPDPTLHLALINMQLPDHPVAFGVIRNVTAPVYDQEMEAQIKHVQETRKVTCVDDLLRSGNTWEVTGKENSASSNCPTYEMK